MFAQQEAHRLGHDLVGPEHIFLGLYSSSCKYNSTTTCGWTRQISEKARFRCKGKFDQADRLKLGTPFLNARSEKDTLLRKSSFAENRAADLQILPV